MGYFRGESNFNVSNSVNLKDLSFPKKIAVFLWFFLWIPFTIMIFSPHLTRFGIMGLIAGYAIYFPASLIYVFHLQERQRTVPLILILIGIIGEIGFVLCYMYYERYGFTPLLHITIVCVPIFLGFLIPGICMLVCGLKRRRIWKAFDKTVTATVTGYKEGTVGIYHEHYARPSMRHANVYSPMIEYEINGIPYSGEIESYFGESQLPPVGGQLEIHVSRTNPHDFILQLQKGGMFIAFGISFIAVALLAAVLVFVFIKFVV